MSSMERVHGGPDVQGVARFDFSTNGNACGPCPTALAEVQAANAGHYPDATYSALRRSLSDFYQVEPWRIVLAASASEFIFRITSWMRRSGASRYWQPLHAYGDYAAAADAWNLQRTADIDSADLVWACEPSSPLGRAHTPWPRWLWDANARSDASVPARPLVLDCAYAPLRLSGAPSLSVAQQDQVWQLWSPNKAMGLTGVRAAFAIAPLDSSKAAEQLDAMAPSWCLGAHGVALLHAWTRDATQTWLRDSLQALSQWKTQQMKGLQSLSWQCLPSDSNFCCACPRADVDLGALFPRLRAAGIQLRDTASFGLPGHVRMSVQAPAAQAALLKGLAAVQSALTTDGPTP